MIAFLLLKSAHPQVLNRFILQTKKTLWRLCSSTLYLNLSTKSISIISLKLYYGGLKSIAACTSPTAIWRNELVSYIALQNNCAPDLEREL